MNKFAFSRELRLLTPEHYKTVFQQAHRAGSPHLTILARSNELDHPRLGLAVPKKQIKTAVDRNRFKRVVRESFRLKQHQLPACDFVVIAKKSANGLSNEELFTLLDKLWHRLSRPSRG
ncbi:MULTISPECIES: ribonuclease P protein component [Photobacterium]|uniref:Ribonuclease P protein component n=5 Tax=Photobacterium TaxID=657 RepID=A0A2T3PIN3_PHOPO|nr:MULTISPECIES: ribonuclease P protein component [Photobacterium]KAE8176090.1 ribonuclease P protein component [Photobacterium carnosum]MBY3789782.1 ribonuclease P protein component [Photobacterium carnosum]MCD9465212.1 ribonuclease P protein component [Photobacterium phosphoreum]MCD9467763.1 ribonuclease P protein component [Photobacterium iliopiscarium]MCD9472366.1 ribonuclease P protein component [Photobacterium phosphoreum]